MTVPQQVPEPPEGYAVEEILEAYARAQRTIRSSAGHPLVLVCEDCVSADKMLLSARAELQALREKAKLAAVARLLLAGWNNGNPDTLTAKWIARYDEVVKRG